jgi:hypothetical protein
MSFLSVVHGDLYKVYGPSVIYFYEVPKNKVSQARSMLFKLGCMNIQAQHKTTIGKEKSRRSNKQWCNMSEAYPLP